MKPLNRKVLEAGAAGVLLSALRVLIGVLFVVSGFEKLIQPPENFLFVIQNYDMLNERLEAAAAHVLPWFELFGGAFLAAGLWTRAAACVVWALNTAFIAAVSQALARKLPIDECGCFGELISLPLPAVLAMDAAVWLACAAMLAFPGSASRLSFDRFLARGAGEAR